MHIKIRKEYECEINQGWLVHYLEKFQPSKGFIFLMVVAKECSVIGDKELNGYAGVFTANSCGNGNGTIKHIHNQPQESKFFIVAILSILY